MKNLFLSLLILPSILLGQEWEKTFDRGTAYSVNQTSDGGYIVIGAGYKYTNCIYMAKTDSYGDTLWTKHYSINETELIPSGTLTTDGGYIVIGTTRRPDSLYDILLLKTNNQGDSIWHKEYGSNRDEVAFSVIQTNDGGFIIAGNTESYSESTDVYIVKTDENGDILWTKTYGDENHNTARSIYQTSDGGYLITTNTSVVMSGIAWVDLIKTDSIGNVLWNSIYDDEDEDNAFSTVQTSDGGYISTGVTETNNNMRDILLIKHSNYGDIEWVKTFGEYDTNESAYCVQQTNDNGFIIAGSKYSSNSAYDVYLIKTNSEGDTLWTRTYGGDYMDYAYAVKHTADGGYIIAGNFEGENDTNFVYLIKTDNSGLLTFTNTFNISVNKKEVVKLIDITGREISQTKPNQAYIEIYSDGTAKENYN